MKELRVKALKVAAPAVGVILSVLLATALSHHSFAMYDLARVVRMTGVLTSFVSRADHAEMYFVPLGPDAKPMRGTDGKPVSWGVEMGAAGAMAEQGISSNTFPEGTIFTVNLHPMRDGKNFGSMQGFVYKCPKDTPPPPGKHCSDVKGSLQVGGRGNF
jgi:hypothetical protein